MDIPNKPSRLRRYGVLGIICVVVAAIVAGFALLTRDRIAASQRAWFVARLEALIPASLRDNDMYADRLLVTDPDLLGASEPVAIYRARKQGQPMAAILSATAPDGYGGPIELLVAVDYQGAVLGVDVLRHNETHGIGDGFLPSRSNWLRSLLGRSLNNPSRERWTIRKDGGDFDEFTGASVTPRAILKAVRNALEYYSRNREMIYDNHAEPSTQSR
jgi:H+/Na+-translocating ferredoxin:NAD+ oxidoreductase subunit G